MSCGSIQKQNFHFPLAIPTVEDFSVSFVAIVNKVLIAPRQITLFFKDNGGLHLQKILQKTTKFISSTKVIETYFLNFQT